MGISGLSVIARPTWRPGSPGTPFRKTSRIAGDMLVAEIIVNLGVDLPRVVAMKAPESQAVIHQQMAIRQVQHRQGRGKALTQYFPALRFTSA